MYAVTKLVALAFCLKTNGDEDRAKFSGAAAEASSR